MPAAMLASVLVGVIRMVADYTHDPAVVLAGLNQWLVERTHASLTRFAFGQDQFLAFWTFPARG